MADSKNLIKKALWPNSLSNSSGPKTSNTSQHETPPKIAIKDVFYSSRPSNPPNTSTTTSPSGTPLPKMRDVFARRKGKGSGSKRSRTASRSNKWRRLWGHQDQEKWEQQKALKGEERMSESLSLKEKSERLIEPEVQSFYALEIKFLREVARERITTSMWLKLESLYMTKSLANWLCLKQQLYTFKMIESRTVTEQLDAILYGKDQDITLEEVQTSIRTKEMQKQQDSKSEDNGESLNISRGRSEKKGPRGKKSKSRSKDSKNGQKTKFKCFNCHKTGQFKKDCLDKIKKGSMDSADIVEASEGYESAGTVLLGDNYPYKVQGIGTVRLNMFDNREYLLKNVRYIPELKRNLISINMFDDLEYSTRTLDGVLKVSKGSFVIAKGNKNKSSGLFILVGSTIVGHASISSNTLIDKTKLWHLRLGHVSERGLHELEKQNLLGGDKLDKLEFCDHCVLGKSHRISFGIGIHVSSRPFEYVHSDLWGPSRVKTHGGSSYFLTIIDI
ncbi:Retrovirus-related Pol polyprotein from transposon TNT 1-94 [Glycine soja]|uniref:Retrovirus-related Pol polyprotein from transposon TNT 1-94 n=1 Tax=Glycine soja TaxID=3848 RepID=A0A445FWZ0_GLYSO|nr:Retrovirus-related Pol polyprotein from transposon TNT 1-94 [Glycine soja]